MITTKTHPLSSLLASRPALIEWLLSHECSTVPETPVVVLFENHILFNFFSRNS